MLPTAILCQFMSCYVHWNRGKIEKSVKVEAIDVWCFVFCRLSVDSAGRWYGSASRCLKRAGLPHAAGGVLGRRRTWASTKLASCCLMLPHVASCCLMLPHVASCCLMLPHVASCCLMLPHVASCCLMLPHVASCCLMLPVRQLMTSYDFLVIIRIQSISPFLTFNILQRSWAESCQGNQRNQLKPWSQELQPPRSCCWCPVWPRKPLPCWGSGPCEKATDIQFWMTAIRSHHLSDLLWSMCFKGHEASSDDADLKHEVAQAPLSCCSACLLRVFSMFTTRRGLWILKSIAQFGKVIEGYRRLMVSIVSKDLRN